VELAVDLNDEVEDFIGQALSVHHNFGLTELVSFVLMRVVRQSFGSMNYYFRKSAHHHYDQALLHPRPGNNCSLIEQKTSLRPL
jgi:hypothetical protein